MPQHTNGRHHIPKMRHVVTNWAEYNAGLRRRGSLTLWITEAVVIAAWAAARRTTTGGQATCFDIVAVTLTDQDVSDDVPGWPAARANRAAHRAGQADGAYDGKPTYQTITDHDTAIAVVIPPQENAVPSSGLETNPSPRDTHLLMIASVTVRDAASFCCFSSMQRSSHR